MSVSVSVSVSVSAGDRVRHGVTSKAPSAVAHMPVRAAVLGRFFGPCKAVAVDQSFVAALMLLLELSTC